MSLRGAAVAAAFLALPAAADDGSFAVILKGQEAKRPFIDRLVPRLGLRPGMTVADLGAGTGQHAVRMARAVGPSGQVWATDIDPRMTAWVEKTAREEGLPQLKAATVTPEGLDPFYRGRRWDLVLVSDVYGFLSDRVRLFDALRATLAPGGRVVVVSYPDRTHAFAREDFADWDGFLADLRKEPASSPFGRRLAAPALRALEGVPAGDACGRERAVLGVLNRLMETDFYLDLRDEGSESLFAREVALTPDERVYAGVRVERLRLMGLPGRRPPERLPLSEVHMLGYLNKLMVIARYRARLAAGGPRPYLSEGLPSRWHREHDAISKEMEAAGYRLVERADAVPFQAVWTFADAGRKGPPPAAPAAERPEPARDRRREARLAALPPGGAEPHAFEAADFADLDGFLADLAKEPAGSPWGRLLAAPLLDTLRGLGEGAGACARLDAVVFHSNRALATPLFEHEAAGDRLDAAGLSPEEALAAERLLLRARLSGFPRRKPMSDLTLAEAREVAALNRLLIRRRYRARLAERPS